MRDGTGTRKKLQDAALALFVDRGITETTVRDIATAAGVAEGTLYRHYPGKDALVWDLFSTNYVRFADTLDALQAGESGCAARLSVMVEAFCRLFDDDPVLFRFLLLVQHQQLGKVTPEMPSPVAVLRAMIVSGMRAGDIPAADPELATALVLGCLLQPATFKVYGRLSPPMTDLAPMLAGACWRVLAGLAPQDSPGHPPGEHPPERPTDRPTARPQERTSR